MALPTPKMPLPGFRLIADDSGSYIDDVNNIRLGPEFVLTRNTADPSAVISVSAYIAAQLAASVPCSKLLDQSFSAASVTIPFTANQYKKIDVNISINGGYLNTIAMTGLSAASYYYESVYGSSATPGAANGAAQDSWVPPGTSGITSADISFNLFPAPSQKSVFLQSMSAGTIGVAMSGQSTDVTHDPTAIVITFDTSRVGYIYAVGWK